MRPRAAGRAGGRRRGRQGSCRRVWRGDERLEQLRQLHQLSPCGCGYDTAGSSRSSRASRSMEPDRAPRSRRPALPRPRGPPRAGAARAPSSARRRPARRGLGGHVAVEARPAGARSAPRCRARLSAAHPPGPSTRGGRGRARPRGPCRRPRRWASLAVERVGMAVDHPKRERVTSELLRPASARQQAAVAAQDERALAAFERGSRGVAWSREAATAWSAAITPDAGSRAGSRNGPTTSPASASPSRSANPALRNRSGARSSPRLAPEESSGAPKSVQGAGMPGPLWRPSLRRRAAPASTGRRGPLRYGLLDFFTSCS